MEKHDDTRFLVVGYAASCDPSAASRVREDYGPATEEEAHAALRSSGYKQEHIGQPWTKTGRGRSVGFARIYLAVEGMALKPLDQLP